MLIRLGIIYDWLLLIYLNKKKYKFRIIGRFEWSDWKEEVLSNVSEGKSYNYFIAAALANNKDEILLNFIRLIPAQNLGIK